eukprot:510078_1
MASFPLILFGCAHLIELVYGRNDLIISDNSPIIGRRRLASYNCADGVDCIIDCDAQFGGSGCNNMIINATTATLLDITCNPCESANINCPINNNYECNINCISFIDDDYPCYNTEIYGGRENNKLNLICRGTDYPNSGIGVNWNCNGLKLYASHIYSANIYCSGYATCRNTWFDFNNVNNAFIYFNGTGDYGYIYAENATSLTVTCDGGYFTRYGSMACGFGSYKLRLYTPSNTTLNCMGKGCSSLEIRSINGTKDMNVSITPFNKCLSPEGCIGIWNLYCDEYSRQTVFDYTTTSIFTGSVCNFDECGCFSLAIRVQNAWTKGIVSMNISNNIADVICNENEDCIVDCDNVDCDDKIIDGRKALSLTISCCHISPYKTCSRTVMHCPERNNSICNLDIGEYGTYMPATLIGNENNIINIEIIDAKGLEVIGYNSIKVNLECLEHYACPFAEIFVTEANDVNILCSSPTTTNNDGACENMKVYAANVNKLFLHCKDYGCNSLKVYANYTLELYVFGDDGYYGTSYMQLYAQNAKNINLTCIGQVARHGCYGLDVYLPINNQNHSIIWNCYGYGCDRIDPFIYDTLPITNNNLIFNGCGLCATLNDCIESWFMKCNYLTDYSLSTTMNIDSCTNNVNCNCSGITTKLLSIFIDKPNMNYLWCSKINPSIPTLEPSIAPSQTTIMPSTIQPTENTLIPSIYPTSNPTSNPTLQPTSITILPTIYPTTYPTSYPTLYPTRLPTFIPTLQPTKTRTPTTNPTSVPSINSTIYPTSIPTINPTLIPTNYPTSIPNIDTDTTSTTYISYSSETTQQTFADHS